MLILVVLFVIQLCYYLRTYARVASYKNNRREAKEEGDVSISVIVTMGDDFLFVENTLPLLLQQDYGPYEVVIVYVGSNDEFAETLEVLSEAEEKLTFSHIKPHPLFPISNKMALNVGIKAAHGDYIVLTTPDARPVSNRWLPMMAKGFTRGDIVLGYCGFEPSKGFADRMIRTSHLIASVRYLSAAIRRKPYRGALQNMGFAKRLYFEVRGFGFLNLNLGENDLFLQQIATPDNVSVVMHTRATVRQKRWGGIGWWLKECKRQGHTYPFYPQTVKNSIEWEIGSRFLFFLTVGAACIWMPAEMKIAAATLLVLRYVAVLSCVRRIGKRLGENRLLPLYFLYDLCSPLLEILIAADRRIRPVKEIWR